MARRETILFSEAQAFRQWHTRIVLAFPPAALLFVTIRQVVFHKAWGSPPASDGGLIFLTILLTAVYFRLITVKLVTQLTASGLAVGLQGLWKRRRIPLEQIRSAEVVTYDAAADFGGYGVRSGRRGAAYIARGERGVQLVLMNGNKVLIGSQVPAGLQQAILCAQKRVEQ